ncbi:MAG: PocR ligand-binding domain-containing protein [Caldilineaceae bacterium]|nr:PocR ligand-binding domain-containing protein [Caldilineaceae bacterium]
MQQERWPFLPARLSALIDPERLAVIEAGCAERLGRAMTIIDYHADQQQADRQPLMRTDPHNHRQNFEPFCQLLRDETRVQGGNAACEHCDQEMAQRLLQRHDGTAYLQFQCHMGLTDAAQVVLIEERPVAVVFAGQFRPAHGTKQIVERVQQLGQGHLAQIQFLDPAVAQDLIQHVRALQPLPADFALRLGREVRHIQQIAEAEYHHRKYQGEQAFLERLRSLDGLETIEDLNQIRHHTAQLLEEVRQFCGCRYLVFFANIQEGETVLAPLAHCGLPAAVEQQLPHFNWRKAGLPLDKAQLKQWKPERIHATAIKGIRGDNSAYFQNLQCILPTSLGRIYRGALGFGPFAEPIKLTREHEFLSEVSRLLGSLVLTELEILNLQQQRKQWESIAKLLTHQVRTALTPITTQVGTAKLLLQRQPSEQSNKLISSSLKGAHELCLRLGKTVAETVESHVLLLEPEDMKFEPYPLSVLVSNCTDAFASEAERRQRQLVVDESIEQLPQAEIDIARLTIALSNLIDNALKYSFPNTKIVIRALQDANGLDLENATLEIQDDGDEILHEQRERIFERGARGLTGAKLRRIPGTGLGLWEARAVIEAHRGAITVRSEPTSLYFRQMRAYRVTFRIKVPLRQEGKPTHGKTTGGST